MLNLINTIEKQGGILPRTENGWQGENWQQLLSKSYLSISELHSRLELPIENLAALETANANFRICAPEPFLKRIQAQNPRDPLLLQILPSHLENQITPGFSSDPLNEMTFNPSSGIIHKYHGRLLLLSNSHCAINCRYCFRRNFPYQTQQNNREQWLKSIEYIEHHQDITEVILSGGDPLASNDTQLQWLVEQLDAIEHLKRLRIHTRLPIAIPQRITEKLLDILQGSRLKSCIVIHCNHPNEIDDDVSFSLKVLSSRNISLLNQSVLLAGINDKAETLIALSEKLFENQVLPYYLHLLDKAQGTAHFDVAQDQALRIYSIMQKKLPGYLLPRLVREEPGELAKTAIIP